MQPADRSGATRSRKVLYALYVEDNERDARLYTRHLEQAGFEVQADIVATLQEFVDALSAKSYDIILADHGLPNWSGADALELLRRRDQDTPFIVVSGSMSDDVAVQSIKNGATDYVLKDRLARLGHAVERALDERTVREARKRAERSRDLLASIVESSDEAIIGMSQEGLILSWNQGAAKIFGYPAEEIQGQPLTRLFPPAFAPEVHQGLTALRSGGKITRYVTVGATRDGGPVDVAMTISSIRQANGQLLGASAIIRDLTEYRQLQSQFYFAQKMEAVGRLAAGVAHDFNNLLTVISGYSSLVLQDLKERAPLADQIQEIYKASERAASLTRQLLAFSRRQILQPQVLDLSGIVRDMERMLQRLIGEDIELVAVLDPSLGSVNADSGQMEQIIMNLAVNARDAMPQGGKLTIETANVVMESEVSRGHLTVPPGAYVMLAVTDTGVGMDAETAMRIFEPFFTTKGQAGTGLGLSTVYGIVEQSGGFILTFTEPGHGTTFKIYLPRIEREVATTEPPPLARVESGSETLLVVEDEDALRALVCEVLRAEGYTVRSAKSGAEALKLSEQTQGIHLMITDVVMPGISGVELAVRMQSVRPAMKVIFMSGYTDNAFLRNGVLSEEMAFLPKPFTPLILTRKVRELLDGPAPGAAQ